MSRCPVLVKTGIGFGAILAFFSGMSPNSAALASDDCQNEHATFKIMSNSVVYHVTVSISHWLTRDSSVFARKRHAFRIEYVE